MTNEKSFGAEADMKIMSPVIFQECVVTRIFHKSTVLLHVYDYDVENGSPQRNTHWKGCRIDGGFGGGEGLGSSKLYMDIPYTYHHGLYA